jgi:hypothetical protein
MRKPAVIFDLDSTLADTRHRQWMIPFIKAKRAAPGHPRYSGNPVTWDDYSMACSGDTPIPGPVFLAQLFRAMNHEVYIVSGRSAAARVLTEKWLKTHDIPWDGIFLRPAGDRTPNAQFKVGILHSLIAAGIVPVLWVDDLAKVGDAIKAEFPDLPFLLVNPGYHGEEGA